MICLAVPAASEAATFCVFAPPGCSGTTEADIPTALTAAAGTSERDQIILGGGVQSNQQFNDAAGNPVDIVGQGSGPGGTELDLANISLAAKLDEPSSTLQNVAIVGVIGNDVLGLSGTGTGLRVAGSDDAIAVTMRTSSTLRNSTASQPGGTGLQVALGADNVTIEDSDISGGYALSNAGRFSGRRLRLTGFTRGLDQQNAATGRLEDALIRMTDPSGIGISVQPTNGDASFVGSHLTVIGDGSGGNQGVRAANAPPYNATVDIRDSIIRNFATALFRVSQMGRVDLNISYSDYDFSKVSDGPNTSSGTGAINSSNNLNNVDPLFVDLGAGDFRLQAGSPMIDAGTPGPLAPTESPTDLNRNPRLLDGNGDCAPARDIGAFEFQPPARNPIARASAPASAQAFQVVAFDASASCDPDAGDTLSYAWRFDDGATATGRTVQHAFDRRGSHSGTVTVTDSTGRTATATATVVVSDTTNPVAGSLAINPATLTPASSGASIARTTGATVTYTLSEPASVKFTVERAGPGRKVRGRCVKPRRSNRSRKRCTRFTTVRGSFTHNGHAGANRFRFTGRLQGKKLKPGSYRLVAVPADLSGNRGKPVRKAFKVKR